MARLASQEKMGYYPTPPPEISGIKKALNITEPGIRFLDPCCGDGEALKLLTEGLQAETFGVELEKSRFEKAQTKLSTVLWADAITETSVSAQMVDVLFINPPYDSSLGTRLELLFLKKYLPTLAAKGVLVLIVPVYALTSFKEIITNYFTEICVYRFGDDFMRFRQCVLIGRRRRLKKEQIEANKEMFHPLTIWPNNLKVGYKGVPIPVGKFSKPAFRFSANHIDPETLRQQVEKERRAFMGKMVPPDLENFTPLLPLKQGHLAMLLAAGYINGEIKSGPYDLVVKGSVERAEETIQEDGNNDVTIHRSRPQITITVLDMSTGRIKELR